MNITRNYEVVKIESISFEIIKETSFVVGKVRKNASPGWYRKCDYCLKKIMQEGETGIIAIEKETNRGYFYHQACYEKAKS